MTSYQLVELGEGYSGEYDPTDPEDRELFRLDAIEDGEEVESLCTALPVTISETDRDKALRLIADFVRSHPDLTPRTITEIFSHMDPSWLVLNNVPAAILRLFGLWSAP